MRWRRREARAATSTEVTIAPRVERALVTLAVHAQQLDGRLDRIERRIEEVDDNRLEHPSHDDVLEVRLHSARVAAELARVTVELRAEIEQVALDRDRQPSPRDRRIQILAEQVLDLSDSIDTRLSDVG
jgi:hypothetical protein